MMTDLTYDVQANERAYERKRLELEKNSWGQWIVVVKEQLVAIAPTLEEALQQAGNVPLDAKSRLIRKVGEELPKVVRKL
jgi:hypothetical protein